MSILDGFNLFIGKILADLAFAFIVLTIIVIVMIIITLVSGGKK